MEKTVAFAGHCPEKINVPQSTLIEKLDETLRELYQQGCKTFLSGMARGFDMLAAEAVIKLRKEYSDVKLVAVIPFMGQELLYSSSEKRFTPKSTTAQMQQSSRQIITRLSLILFSTNICCLTALFCFATTRANRTIRCVS